MLPLNIQSPEQSPLVNNLNVGTSLAPIIHHSDPMSMRRQGNNIEKITNKKWRNHFSRQRHRRRMNQKRIGANQQFFQVDEDDFEDPKRNLGPIQTQEFQNNKSLITSSSRSSIRSKRSSISLKSVQNSVKSQSH